MLDFVYPYFAAGAHGNELQISIDSIKKHYQGEARITVIGDRPDWYQGQHLPIQRVKAQQHRAFRDTFNRLMFAANTKLIGEQFVWMMDDIFFVKPISTAQLRTARHQGERNGAAIANWRPTNKWLRLKKSTMQKLIEKGHKIAYDYATHLPHLVNKTNLRAMRSEFNMPREIYLWEVLYGNLFGHEPRRVDLKTFFYRFTRPQEYHVLKSRFNEATVVNSGNSGWNSQAEKALNEIVYGDTPKEVKPDPPPRPPRRPPENPSRLTGIQLANQMAIGYPCPHRGAFVELKDNRLCSMKKKASVPVYECSYQKKRVTISPYVSGQPEGCCKRCDKFTGWKGPENPPDSKPQGPNGTWRKNRRLTAGVPVNINEDSIAVTSLRQVDDPRQGAALDSWSKHQMRIFAVQSIEDDIAELAELYPQVTHWKVLPEPGKPRISEIVAAMSEITTDTYMLLNSDIELSTTFIYPKPQPGTLMVGLRQNYVNEFANSKQERWGIDVFFVTKSIADGMRDAPFTIGEPWWDYWMMYHARDSGHALHRVPQKFFYHRKHQQQWDKANHDENHRIFCEMYGLPSFSPSRWRKTIRREIGA